jgi:hypothetical protein
VSRLLGNEARQVGGGGPSIGLISLLAASAALAVGDPYAAPQSLALLDHHGRRRHGSQASSEAANRSSQLAEHDTVHLARKRSGAGSMSIVHSRAMHMVSVNVANPPDEC